jgi:phosphomannomutase
LHFAVHAYGLDGGIMVTGSHNPREENGFKLMIGMEPVHGEALRALVAGAASPAPGGTSVDFPVLQPYTSRLQSGDGAGRVVVAACLGHRAQAHHPLRGGR